MERRQVNDYEQEAKRWGIKVENNGIMSLL